MASSTQDLPLPDYLQGKPCNDRKHRHIKGAVYIVEHGRPSSQACQHCLDNSKECIVDASRSGRCAFCVFKSMNNEDCGAEGVKPFQTRPKTQRKRRAADHAGTRKSTKKRASRNGASAPKSNGAGPSASFTPINAPAAAAAKLAPANVGIDRGQNMRTDDPEGWARWAKDLHSEIKGLKHVADVGPLTNNLIAMMVEDGVWPQEG